MDIDEVVKEIANELNGAYSKLGKLTNLRYNLLLYNLVKKGVPKAQLAEAAGISTVRLYQIIEEVEKFHQPLN